MDFWQVKKVGATGVHATIDNHKTMCGFLMDNNWDVVIKKVGVNNLITCELCLKFLRLKRYKEKHKNKKIFQPNIFEAREE